MTPMVMLWEPGTTDVTAIERGHQGVTWLLLAPEDTNSGAADTIQPNTALLDESCGNSKVAIRMRGPQS